MATGGTAVLFPRLRWDATLVSDPGLAAGLVVVTGYTHVDFGAGSAASIASAGPIYYHGPMILSALGRVQHDEAGGATTGSGEVAGQFGREGTAWTGVSLSAGHEAYQVIGATPFDAQFTSVGGSVFHQRWFTRTQSVVGRLDYQDKRTAYHRRGATLGYRVAF